MGWLEDFAGGWNDFWGQKVKVSGPNAGGPGGGRSGVDVKGPGGGRVGAGLAPLNSGRGPASSTSSRSSYEDVLRGRQQDGPASRAYMQGIDENRVARRAQMPQQQPDFAPLSFMDALAQAKQFMEQQGLGAGGGPDYGGLRSATQGIFNERDAQLQAMTRQLVGSIQGNAPGIQKIHDTAIQGYDQNAAQATEGITEGYDAARGAQTQQLQSLGIEDAAVNNALKEGGGAAAEQGQAVANVEQNRAASVNQGTTAKTAALDLNRSLAGAAQLEGQSNRGALAQALAERLADIGLREQEADASQGAQNQSFMMQLAQQFQGDDNNAFDRAQQLAQMQAEMAQAAQPQQQGLQGQGFIDQVGQITNQLMQTYPDLSQNEALQRAYQLLNGSQ